MIIENVDPEPAESETELGESTSKELQGLEDGTSASDKEVESSEDEHGDDKVLDARHIASLLR